MQKVSNVRELGFVGETMWEPDESGVYALDNKIGRTHADQCVDLMRRQGNPSILSHVVKDMVGRGRYGGVEVGFMHRVADHAVRQIEPV